MKVEIKLRAIDIEEIDTKLIFVADLDYLPRTGDEFSIEGSPEEIKALTGVEELYGIVDSIEWIIGPQGKLKSIVLWLTVNEEIEEEIFDAWEEQQNT